MPNDSPLVSQYLEHISGTALDQYQKIIRGLVQRRSGVYPERFPAGLPHPPGPPVEVWINPPKTRATEEALLH